MDQALLFWLNGFVGQWPAFDHFVDGVSGDHVLRSTVPVFLFGLCWFGATEPAARARMALGLVAMCVAAIASVALQMTLNVHSRPLLDPSLGIHSLTSPELLSWVRFKHPNSFPSDTTTLYTALATVIFMERRALGLVALVWAIAVVALPRAYFGFHYPSDLLAGMLLGGGVVALATRWKVLIHAAERLLTPTGIAYPAVNALLLAFFIDMATLFSGSRSFVSLLLSLVR